MQIVPLNKLILKFPRNSVIEHFCIIKYRPISSIYEKKIRSTHTAVGFFPPSIYS